MAASPRSLVASIAACGLLLAACGQKGPPLAPLRLVPAEVTEVSVRRVEDRARLRLLLPSANANGPGPVELDRVEVFAVTIGPGVPPPPNRDLLAPQYLIGEVRVRPAPVEGEAPAEGETRPAPGEAVTFEEELTPQKLTPAPIATPAPAAGSSDSAARPGTDPGAAAKAEAPAAKPPADPVRLYVARGVTRGGRPGPPSTRASLPVVSVPPPPTGIAARTTETAVVLEWTAPAEAPAASYNIYLADDLLRPVNVSAVTTTAFEHAAPFGQEHCYRLRSVSIAGEAIIEGEPSAPACITPRDVFPPAAPQGLVAVPTPGQISLIWDSNAEKDLAGYLVLRGDAPDGELRALMATPIRETSYRDATVTSGNRYIYAVVAVDTATPPNTSPQSARIEETAR